MNHQAGVPEVVNLHNHTRFSDGAYTIDELCEAHLALPHVRVAGIGICDHLFCTPSSRQADGPREFARLFARETREYVALVRRARQRWAGRLEVWCGAEIHWPLNRRALEWIPPLLEGLDYVLFEHVDWAGLTQLAHVARRWPCPIGLAHACVPRQFPSTPMEQVIRTLANARIFYEINSKLLPLRDDDPWLRLLPQHRVRISFGTDTHDDLRVLDDLRAMRDFVVARGLGGRLFVPGSPDAARVSAAVGA